MDVMPLVNAAKYIEDQIFYGVGVPPELVRAGGTGSGYSGRSIPRESFLAAQQKIADEMLQKFVEQVLRPLVLWNFGDIPFEISCRSLLETMADAKQDQLQQPGGIRREEVPTQRPMPFSVDEPERSNRIAEIIRKVQARSA